MSTRPPLPCSGLTTLFYGPDGDGRQERNRHEREEKAKAICFTCAIRLMCLENALVLGEELGVWGGMSEAERKKFLVHLRAEGYEPRTIPEGLNLWAAVNAFYRSREHVTLALEYGT